LSRHCRQQCDKVHLPTCLGLVVEVLRRYPAQRGEHQILQQAVAIGEDSGTDRGRQGVIDTVGLAGIDADPGRRAGKDVHAEQQPGILEPDEPIDQRAFAHPVAERFQVVGQVTDGVEGAGVVHQPVRQIDHRPRVGNVVVPDDTGEDGVPVRLMGQDALPLVEPVNTGEAADLPITLERLLDDQPLLGGERAVALDALAFEKLPKRKREDLPGDDPAGQWTGGLLIR